MRLKGQKAVKSQHSSLNAAGVELKTKIANAVAVKDNSTIASFTSIISFAFVTQFVSTR